MLIGALLIVACGAGSIPIHEYILDVDKGMLRASKPKDDKPIAFCQSTICYVYEDQDVRKIKKYIIELETRLKNCQKHDISSSP